jgi:hypothetical protein
LRIAIRKGRRCGVPRMLDTQKGNGKRPLCFVIGPIGKDGSPERKHSDLLLNAVIKHVLQQDEFGYLVKRADEDADPGMIGDRMISDIIHSELVVADLTDLNPNAFMSLGLGTLPKNQRSILREWERCCHSTILPIAPFS